MSHDDETIQDVWKRLSKHCREEGITPVQALGVCLFAGLAYVPRLLSLGLFAPDWGLWAFERYRHNNQQRPPPTARD